MLTQATYRRRLAKLADVLEANARNKKGAKFDLGDIASLKWTYDAVDKKAPVKMDCGTTGCAIGLACVSRAFKGLSVEQSDCGGLGLRMNGEPTNFRTIAEEYFGTSYDVSSALFTPEGMYWDGLATEQAAGERNVVKAIRYYLKTGEVAEPGTPWIMLLPKAERHPTVEVLI